MKVLRQTGTNSTAAAHPLPHGNETLKMCFTCNNSLIKCESTKISRFDFVQMIAFLPLSGYNTLIRGETKCSI